MRNALLLVLAFVSIGCSKKVTGTPNGTKVLEWSRGPVTFSTGVSLGKDLGAATTDQRMVTFTPKDRRDPALGIVRLDVRIDRGDTEIVPNNGGQRPAEKGTAPRHIDVTLVENHGWQVSGKCDEKILGPGAGEPPGGVTFSQSCQVQLSSGEDIASVLFTANGDGKHQFIGGFGTVATVP